ncbi:MAG TPA: MBL fold metallo-hydrolase [Longimicrobium sp.]|jgi:glyoxylase-like metal-dependent hydrolase (beta-lactamase superfamily II)|uniref:MBL fold metallo-hydrolase n=1 Tax=Longimicrobium sp. TaxID=2029185 RepID=UPI002ED86780
MLQTILAPNPSPMTLDGTRTYVVGRERPVVVDPGPADAAHLDAIAAALDGRPPVAILLTHAHSDHAAATRPLAARTGAPVWMAAGGLGPKTEIVTRWIEDGARVETDAGVLTAAATPGHAPEHVCFLWTEAPAEHERALLAGDMFMGGGDTTLVAPPEGDLTQYLASLDRLEALRPSIIHPAHGPPIADGMEAIRRYRAHRASRIDQVVRALRQGDAAPGELIDRIYGPELHPGLRGAAEGSLRAILAHLAATGRARAAGDRHHLTER